MLQRITNYCLSNPLVVLILFSFMIIWGLSVSPFDWAPDLIPRNPINVDAIPDLGENQQIIQVKWEGRSPQEIENQITYPLTSALLGTAGVKTIRSSSMNGLSTLFVIFEENVDYYWSRSRLIEKLSSLPSNLLPNGVTPTLGPDATGLGQLFWYTIEGRDKQNGESIGGWSLEETRRVQDFYVKQALNSVKGVSEVASVGGYVKEYQVEIDPIRLAQYSITVQQIAKAIKENNRDTGARTMEINQVEYYIRGLGTIDKLEDIEEIVLKENENSPIYIKDVAFVTIGPSQQRGYLDKNGVLVSGGVVISRYDSNPSEVILRVKKKIQEISAGLPEKVLQNGKVTKLEIIPFYDRTSLIRETVTTLEDALLLQIIITIIVVTLFMKDLKVSIIISVLLPISVINVFVIMKLFKVDANIVSLSGIAIAIGTMVDMGIILVEHMTTNKQSSQNKKPIELIKESLSEVGGAVLTAVATTVISFLPVFTMIETEGKLFKPLAFTKTSALVTSIIVSMLLLPVLMKLIWNAEAKLKFVKIVWKTIKILTIIGLLIKGYYAFAIVISGYIFLDFLEVKSKISNDLKKYFQIGITVLVFAFYLTDLWIPLGASQSIFSNYLFVITILTGTVGFFALIIRYYQSILRLLLKYRYVFLIVLLSVNLLSLLIWLGWRTVFFISDESQSSNSDQKLWVVERLDSLFPGLGKEFMPSLDEGTFLLMPTTLPHAGTESILDYLQQMDLAIAQIPEIDWSVGKAGRAETALDPAPLSMFETVIQYKSEYVQDEKGRKVRGYYDRINQIVLHQDSGYIRQWRDFIKTPDDIWSEVVKNIQIPGLTSAPKLQPIQTRIIMLQSGMRSPMGIKVMGSDREQMLKISTELESILKGVPMINPSTVFSEKIIDKPYIEINWNRNELAQFGLSIDEVQSYLELALGGMPITYSLEGRERFAIRIRIQREDRNDIDALKSMYLLTRKGQNLRLRDLAEVRYSIGSEMIRSENTFLTNYILFDKKDGFAETDVVKQAQKIIDQHLKSGSFTIPSGISFEFSGTYLSQIHAEKRLSIVLPIVLTLIFLILYLQFKSVPVSIMIFYSIFIAWSGGFILLWFYDQSWFFNFSLAGVSMRELFQMETIHLSVAVWVGFIALFGIATDDAVLISTYITQKISMNRVESKKDLNELIIEAGLRRIKPAVMTSATTLIALLPVLSSQGKGSDIMVPMAIPTFGGMLLCILTVFTIPILYSIWYSFKHKLS